MEKTNKKKTLVFFDVSVDGDPCERMVFELFMDVAPKTAENFRALCTGEKGLSSITGKPLHYKGTFLHRIIKGVVAKGGDFLRQDGKFGESIYGGKFPDEAPKLKHDGPGVLSMSIADRDERGSLFNITFQADHHLDRKCVVFGKLVDGYEVLKKIENAGDEEGRPAVTVKIINSGELQDDRKRGSKSLKGKDDNEENTERRKRRHKKSSRRRRKKRRYYSSESDSSTDTDSDSSNSESESESDASSLSVTSSSSDDKHKKRKRSKRDKHKRGKRKDRRHDKRRKRREKKSKRKSKRKSSSDGEHGGRDGSSSEDNNAAEAADGKLKTSGNQSPLVASQDTATTNHKRDEVTGISERVDEVKFPKENGDRQTNGVRVSTESDRGADARHLNSIHDHPRKSRSRSLSPRRASSNSMSISPERNVSRSPSPRHGRSRSRSPRQTYRNRINSAVRSESSRSPVRSPPPRSIRARIPSEDSKSPPRRIPSRSPTPIVERIRHSPPRTSSQRSRSRSPWISRGRPSRRSSSRSPVRSGRRSISGSPGRAHRPRRSPSQSPPLRMTTTRRERSPVSDRGRSSSRSRSVDDRSPGYLRRRRGFGNQYSYARRYRSRSAERSLIRSHRFSGRNDGHYRRSPRRYRSPPRGRTSPRYRGRRSRTRSPSPSRSPIRYRPRRYSRSRSPIRSRSSVERYRAERRRSPPRSVSRSRSVPRSPNSGSSSRSPPPKTSGLVSYGDGSPDSGRD